MLTIVGVQDILTTYLMCGYRISVILQPSKLERWVRFPLPAPLFYALLAQLVEHLTLNQGVPGSNP